MIFEFYKKNFVKILLKFAKCAKTHSFIRKYMSKKGFILFLKFLFTNKGGVYLVRRQGSNILARGVCAHMYFNWQMATQWQVNLLINKLKIKLMDRRLEI